jgi:hypothetical protein
MPLLLRVRPRPRRRPRRQFWPLTAPGYGALTRVMGGTDGRGWWGNDAFGGADSTVSTTFGPVIPAGYGVIVCLAIYGYTPADASLLSIAGAGNSLTLDDQIAYGGGVGGSVNFFSGILASECSSIGYDATSLPAGDNGRYGHMMFYLVRSPDTVNGFKTVTGITREVTTGTTTVDPTNSGASPLVPATNDMLVILGWTNQGHSEDLLPLDVPTEFETDLQHTKLHVVTDSPNDFGSVHNSITQSGSFIATRYTAGTPYSPVVTFEGSSPSSGYVRSVLTAYNILGGSPIVAGTVPVFQASYRRRRVH